MIYFKTGVFNTQHYLFIDKKYQSKGYGTKIMYEFIKIDCLFIVINETEPQALKFYKNKFNFKEAKDIYI